MVVALWRRPERRGRNHPRMSSAFIVVDVALAVALIVASVGSWGIDRSQMGIQTEQFLSAQVRLPRVEPGPTDRRSAGANRLG